MSELLKDIDISLLVGFQRGILPDPLMTVSEWADAKRILADTSAEPGRFKTSRTPYLKEIMDKLSVRDPAQKIVCMKGSQLGFTEAGNNWVGYTIDLNPCSMLYIMPTDTMMKKTSKQRIEPMIESTPALKEKVAKTRTKTKGSTLLEKEFIGGHINMVGANSPVGLSSTPVRNIYGDEIARYPESVGQEGSAVDLADTRTSTFGSRRKIFLTSTPTHPEDQIDIEFQKTGQRYYHVPCPYCQEYQVLEFKNLKYVPGKYQQVTYTCNNCGEGIEEHHKEEMLAKGEWRAKFPEKEDGYTFGYHLSAIYSPPGMYTWAKMTKDYEEAKGNVPKLITFTNTKLGECYQGEAGDKPDWEFLYKSAQDYPENKPFASVAVITAGVDVQADRLEVEVVGWMKGMQSQSICYRTLIGDTSQDEVWNELSAMLSETWERDGDKIPMPIRLMALDTGYNTQRAYKFARKHGINRVCPIKGMDRLNMPFSPPKVMDFAKAGKKIGQTKVWGLGVSLLKSEIYGYLKLRVNHETGEIPNGYCYFPKRPPSYFEGLTAEELTLVKNKRQFDAYQWVKKYKRNEPLDCRVYARGAAAILRVDTWGDERWNKEANNYDIPTPTAVTSKPKKIKKRPTSLWDQ